MSARAELARESVFQNNTFMWILIAAPSGILFVGVCLVCCIRSEAKKRKEELDRKLKRNTRAGESFIEEGLQIPSDDSIPTNARTSIGIGVSFEPEPQNQNP